MKKQSVGTFAAHLVALNVGWMGTLKRAFTLFVLFFFPVMLYHTLTDCWVEGNLFSFLPLALIWRYMNPQAGTAFSPLFWGCCWCWATLKRYIFFVSLLSACFSNCNITSSGGGFSGGCYTSLHTSHQSKRTTHNYSPMNMHLLISRLLVGTIFFSTVCRMRVINLWLLFYWIHFFLSLLEKIFSIKAP